MYSPYIMHRTQIYLEDAQYESLRSRAECERTSISELIRQAIGRDLARSASADFERFLAELRPLDSFAGVEPEAYVREVRSTSRLATADHDA